VLALQVWGGLVAPAVRCAVGSGEDLDAEGQKWQLGFSQNKLSLRLAAALCRK